MSMRNVLAAILAVGLSAPAGATTFGVDELIDIPGGDFDGSLSPGNDNVGTAGEGFNYVLGELMGECVPGDCNGINAGDAQDSFAFTIDAGFELVGITGGTEGFGPDRLSISFSLEDSGFNNLAFETLAINDYGTISTDVFGPGTYYFSVFGQSAADAGSYGAFWGVDFEVRAVAVDPVPLPAGLPLLAAGLGGLAIAKRRKRA